ALHCARDQRGQGKPARRRLSRYRVDQTKTAERRRVHQKEIAEHVPPVQATGRDRHYRAANGSWADNALHHGRHSCRSRHAKVAVTGNREYNPGWHTALDLKNLLTVSEAITRAAFERKESRGAQFREDYPDKDDALGKVNTIMRKEDDGSMEVRLEPLPEMPG